MCYPIACRPRFQNDGTDEGLKAVWEVLYFHFHLDKLWNVKMEVVLMAQIGLRYDETGIRGNRFVVKNCVAQTLPKARAELVKIVMNRLGSFHDRCLQEEGSGVKDKTKWDVRFITTWTLKGQSKRSAMQKQKLGKRTEDFVTSNVVAENTEAGFSCFVANEGSVVGGVDIVAANRQTPNDTSVTVRVDMGAEQASDSAYNFRTDDEEIFPPVGLADSATRGGGEVGIVGFAGNVTMVQDGLGVLNFPVVVGVHGFEEKQDQWDEGTVFDSVLMPQAISIQQNMDNSIGPTDMGFSDMALGTGGSAFQEIGELRRPKEVWESHDNCELGVESVGVGYRVGVTQSNGGRAGIDDGQPHFVERTRPEAESDGLTLLSAAVMGCTGQEAAVEMVTIAAEEQGNTRVGRSWGKMQFVSLVALS